MRSGDSIAFKNPQGARPSLLGLDKLAADKRAQAAANGAHPNKRVKLEEQDENGASSSGGIFKGDSSVFEGMFHTHLAVPSIPVKREAVRQRADDTPSQ